MCKIGDEEVSSDQLARILDRQAFDKNKRGPRGMQGLCHPMNLTLSWHATVLRFEQSFQGEYEPDRFRPNPEKPRAAFYRSFPHTRSHSKECIPWLLAVAAYPTIKEDLPRLAA